MKLKLHTSASLIALQMVAGAFSAGAVKLQSALESGGVDEYTAKTVSQKVAAGIEVSQEEVQADRAKLAAFTAANAVATPDDLKAAAAFAAILPAVAVIPGVGQELTSTLALVQAGMLAIEANEPILANHITPNIVGGHVNAAEERTAIEFFVKLDLPVADFAHLKEDIAYLQTQATATNAAGGIGAAIPEPSLKQVQAVHVLRHLLGVANIDQPTDGNINHLIDGLRAVRDFGLNLEQIPVEVRNQLFVFAGAAAAGGAALNIPTYAEMQEGYRALIQAHQNGGGALAAIVNEDTLHAACAFMDAGKRDFTAAQIQAWALAGAIGTITRDAHRDAIVQASQIEGVDFAVTPRAGEGVAAINRINAAAAGTFELDTETVLAAYNGIRQINHPAAVTADDITEEQILAVKQYNVLKAANAGNGGELRATVRMMDGAINITPHHLDDVRAMAAVIGANTAAGHPTPDAQLKVQYGLYRYADNVKQADIVDAITAFTTGGFYKATPKMIETWINPSTAVIKHIKHNRAGVVRGVAGGGAATIGGIPGGRPDFNDLTTNHAATATAVRAWIVDHYTRGGEPL